jgi:hypothetical protein
LQTHDDLFSRIKNALGIGQPQPSAGPAGGPGGRLSPAASVKWARFQDPLDNFVIRYPKNWKFDRDVAVVEGAYTIGFSSPDGRCTFNIAVDAGLLGGPGGRSINQESGRRGSRSEGGQNCGFDFPAYAKAALESPSSGIYTPVKKAKFRDMPAYERDYTYHSSGTAYSAGGTMFFTGRAVFSISWNAPEREKARYDALFKAMLESMIILPGMARPAFRP